MTPDPRKFIAEARAVCEAATEGPWRWEINLAHKNVNLCGGNPRGGFGAFDLTVIGFRRWGMSGAAPVFLGDRNILHRVDEMTKVAPGREHHEDWFRLVDHPDAQFIEHARTALPHALDLLEAALDEQERLTGLLQQQNAERSWTPWATR